MLKSFGQGLAVVATVSLLAVGCDTGGRILIADLSEKAS